MYTFDYESNNSLFASHIHPLVKDGVHHGDELFYLFPFVSLNEKDTKIAKRMIDLWTSFAITGIPKAEGIPEWPPVTSRL